MQILRAASQLLRSKGRHSLELEPGKEGGGQGRHVLKELKACQGEDMGNHRLGSNASILLAQWEMTTGACKTEVLSVLPLLEKMDGKKRKADPGGPGLEGLTGGRHMLGVACELNRKGVEGRMGGALGSRRGALVNSSAGPATVSRGVGVAREPRGGLQVFPP